MLSRNNNKFCTSLISTLVICMLVTVGLIGLFTVTQEVNAVGPTDIGGVINTNTTWTAANSPYIIKKNTTVMQGYTLTIQAGTTVKFENNTRLNIRGKLLVLGNSANRVVFTANSTKYNYSVESEIDGKKNWYHGSGVNYSIFVDVYNGAETNIFWAKFEYCTDYVLTSNYRLHTSKEIIINDTLFENNKWGISPGWVNYIFNRCTFENNFVSIYNIEHITVNYYFEIYDSIFKNNTYGIYSDEEVNKKYSIKRCSFKNNFAGIYDLYGYPEIFDSIFENNTFGVYSGAEIYNCSFIANYFGARMGYSVSISYPRLYVRFSTFTNNSVGFLGYLAAKNSIITNKVGIIAFAGASIANNNICNNTEYNLKFLYGYTDWSFSGNWWGTTNTLTIEKYIFDVWDEANLYEAKYKPILTSPVNITPTPPVAVAGPNQNVTTDQVVYFDATGSYDDDMDDLMHKWDFGDGNESVWASISYKLTHIYTVPGNYTATLTVTDAMFTDTDTCIIRVNSPPVAKAGLDQYVEVDQEVTFDGKKSYDPDGDALTYKWDFGDGSSTGWLSQSNTYHTYKKSGHYNVTLTVSDGVLTDNDICMVIVTEPKVNHVPVADAGPDQNVLVKQVVYFYGGNSTDPDGDLLYYKWTFGDGSMTSWLTIKTTNHRYNTSGKYIVNLTVYDGFLTDNDVCIIMVSESKVNHAPVANAGLDQNVLVNQIVYFDGINSTDADGDTLSYKWIFGDGNSTGWMNGSKVTHRYSVTGNYTVTLSVSDGSLMDNDTCLINVSTIKINHAPVADAGSDQKVKVNETVYFDSSGSSDPDGDVLTYNWSFGDGTITGWFNKTKTSHLYSKIGNYTVKLTVSDGKLTDIDSCKIQVIGTGGGNGSGGNGSGGNGSSGNKTGGNETSSSPTTDDDTDGDGYPNQIDLFPTDPTEWNDTDFDGFGDNSDKFPEDVTQWNDSDGDGYGDNPIGNSPDQFPQDPTEWKDTDRDGYGDNSDAFPNDPEEWRDSDNDGIGDNKDDDKEDLSPVEDKIISDAIDRGDVAGIMSIDKFGIGKADTYIEGTSIQLINVDENSIEFLVRGEAEGGKVIILNIDPDCKFRVSNLNDINVKLDGEAISSSIFTTVLTASGNEGLYCISIGDKGTQILVYIPQFSEHRVLIEKETRDEPKPDAPFFSWFIFLVAIIGIMLIIIIAVIKQYIRSRAANKRSKELKTVDDYEKHEMYDIADDSTNYGRLREEKVFHHASVSQKTDNESILDTKFNKKLTYNDIYKENDKTSNKPRKKKKILHKNKQTETNNDKLKLVGLKKELMNLKESDNFKYDRGELISLLESKYQSGEVTQDTYNSIKDDIHGIVSQDISK